MSTTPEGKIKKKLDDWLKVNMPGCFRYRAPGGMFGSGGIGDYIIVYAGTPIMIEVKADDTKVATPLQMKRLKEFQSAGGISCLLKGFELSKLQAIKKMCEVRQLREVLNTPNSGDFAGSDEYSIWFRTKSKCTNPSFSGYSNYGAVGIKIHEAWVDDFKSFYDHVGPRPTLLHTLDRIDPEGHYEPGNVRWADKTIQANNKTNVKKETYKGDTDSVSQLARRHSKIDPEIVCSRFYRYGWSLEDSIEQPLYGGNRKRHES
jgi:hypothetical protein